MAYIEKAAGVADQSQPSVASLPKQQHNFGQFWQGIGHLLSGRVPQVLTKFWGAAAQRKTQRVAIIVGITMLTLIVLGTIVLKAVHPQESWLRTLYVTGVMLLGSYDVVYNGLSKRECYPAAGKFR